MSVEEEKGQSGGGTEKRVCGGDEVQEKQHDLVGQDLRTRQ